MNRQSYHSTHRAKPGESAVCAVNWHGGYRPWGRRTKWAFRAVDEAGTRFDAEAEIRSKIILNRRSVTWAIALLALLAALLLGLVFQR